ncbi:hypothetical protein XH89_24055 [Bradyrhizobium sp. CCBAU 53340]|nr:hypothetical protein XH89_24055 [Bradyrhizobium sp. CCBAU 53340]
MILSVAAGSSSRYPSISEIACLWSMLSI